MSIRDLVLAIFLSASLPVALVRPFYGAMIFMWLGLMNPHRLGWTFIDSLPWSMMFAFATIAGMLLRREGNIASAISQYRWVLLYLAWMGITSAFALSPAEALTKYLDVTKVHLMALLTLAMLNSRKRIEAAAVVMTVSIAFYGVKGGIFTLLGGGSSRVYGPPYSAIEDNNHLAVALVMVIPMLYWVTTRYRTRLVLLACQGAMLLCAAAVFGSHSRGALLAISTMALFFVLNSNRKLAAIPLVVIGAILAVYFMPQEYWNRMDTITTYEEDRSAMGRINAWNTAINVANSRATGGGFEFWTPMNFANYGGDPDRYQGAHSIYFQAIGEHGWIGLALYLLALFAIWRAARRIKRSVKQGQGEARDAVLANMIQVSLIGFMTGGAFLNLAYWDFPYYQFVAIVALGALLKREDEAVRLEGRGSQHHVAIRLGGTGVK